MRPLATAVPADRRRSRTGPARSTVGAGISSLRVGAQRRRKRTLGSPARPQARRRQCGCRPSPSIALDDLQNPWFGQAFAVGDRTAKRDLKRSLRIHHRPFQGPLGVGPLLRSPAGREQEDRCDRQADSQQPTPASPAGSHEPLLPRHPHGPGPVRMHIGAIAALCRTWAHAWWVQKRLDEGQASSIRVGPTPHHQPDRGPIALETVDRYAPLPMRYGKTVKALLTRRLPPNSDATIVLNL